MDLPALPKLPPSAGRGVYAVLRREPHTCLERAFVLQRWRAAQGELRDVIVGIKGRAGSSARTLGSRTRSLLTFPSRSCYGFTREQMAEPS